VSSLVRKYLYVFRCWFSFLSMYLLSHPYIHLFISVEALERESVSMKKRKKKNWNFGFELSVQLCLLLVRSKHEYPYFTPVNDGFDSVFGNSIFDSDSDIYRSGNSDTATSSTCVKRRRCHDDKNDDDESGKNNDTNENNNNTHNKINNNRNQCKTNINSTENLQSRISHSFLPLTGLRGHCWKRVLTDMKHTGKDPRIIQHVVSSYFSISAFFFVSFNFHLCLPPSFLIFTLTSYLPPFHTLSPYFLIFTLSSFFPTSLSLILTLSLLFLPSLSLSPLYLYS
jgi:hypothetical protein